MKQESESRVWHGAFTEVLLARKGGSLFKSCNTADDGFPARPMGVYQRVHG